MKLAQKLSAIFDRIIYVAAWFVCGLLVFMAASMSVDVMMRYFLNRPLMWTLEFAEYSLLFITFLGAAWVLRTEGHVRVDTVVNQLTPRVQMLVNTITSIVGAMICLAVVWYGAEATWDYLQKGVVGWSTLRIPQAPLLAVIPVGSFLLFIQFLKRGHGYLQAWRSFPLKEQSL